jgi:hypothetical protein
MLDTEDYLPPVDLRAVCLVRAIVNQRDDARSTRRVGGIE